MVVVSFELVCVFEKQNTGGMIEEGWVRCVGKKNDTAMLTLRADETSWARAVALDRSWSKVPLENIPPWPSLVPWPLKSNVEEESLGHGVTKNKKTALQNSISVIRRLLFRAQSNTFKQ
jgi:hypothetical protein